MSSLTTFILPITFSIVAVALGLFFLYRSMRDRHEQKGELLLWRDTEIKQKKLLAECEKAANGLRAVVVATHFPATQRWLQGALDDALIPYKTFAASEDFLAFLAHELTGAKAPILLIDTSAFRLFAETEPVAGKPKLRMIEAELYPTPARGQMLSRLFALMPSTTEYRIFGAMDSLVLMEAINKQMEGLLKALNMPADEPLEGQLVLASIARRQKKNLANMAHDDMCCDSIEEWHQHNSLC